LGVEEVEFTCRQPEVGKKAGEVEKKHTSIVINLNELLIAV